MKLIVSSIVALTATSALMGAVNTAACTGCHGADWSKPALGKSKVVSTMTHAEVEAALLSFKAGKTGTIMKGQVAKYSEQDLKDLAKTLGK